MESKLLKLNKTRTKPHVFQVRLHMRRLQVEETLTRGTCSTCNSCWSCSLKSKYIDRALLNQRHKTLLHETVICSFSLNLYFCRGISRNAIKFNTSRLENVSQCFCRRDCWEKLNVILLSVRFAATKTLQDVFVLGTVSRKSLLQLVLKHNC